MEPLSVIFSISAGVVAMYQMSGTPILLNILIFCFCTILALYAMFISGFQIPSETLYDWLYESRDKSIAKDMNKNKLMQCENNDDQITKRLRELTGHIVRDFILSWYNTVSDDVTFVQEAFEIFEHVLKGSREKVTAVDRDKLLSDVLTEILKHHIIYQKTLDETSRNRTASDQEDKKLQEQLHIIAYQSENGNLALRNLPDSEMEYLRGLVVLLLKGLLPPDYEIAGTSLYIVRELIAQNVLYSLANLVSDPLWVYSMLVKILDDDENDEMREPSLETPNLIRVPDHVRNATDNASENNPEVSQEPSVSDTDNTPESETNLMLSIGNVSAVLRETSEEDLSTSPSTTTFSNSQISVNNEADVQEVLTSSLNDDLPLPLTSSLMHFTPEDGQEAVLDALTSPESSVLIAKKPSIFPPERLFFKIRIPESTAMQENFDGGGKYTLYRITYKTKGAEKKPHVDGSLEECSHECASDDPSVAGKSVPRNNSVTNNQFDIVKHQVQRRFREFLVLQERLSQNMVAKTLMVDIKGPSRMFPVPFGNMDKDYIEQRRKFLQAYLREICSIPFISNCREVREFLAYESDPRIAYVKKPDPLPRFDKLLRSAFQDLFGSTTMKFSNTLLFEEDEEFDSEPLRILRHRHQSEPQSSTGDEKSPNNVGAVAKLKHMVLGSSSKYQETGNNMKRQLTTPEGNRTFVPETWIPVAEICCSSTPDTRLEMRYFTRTSGDGCEAEEIVVDEKAEQNPESKVEDVLFRFLLHVSSVNPGIHNLLPMFLGKFVHRYMTKKMEHLTTKENWSTYLKLLRDSMWPNGQWSSVDTEKVTWLTASPTVKAEAMQTAQAAIGKALPDAIGILVGQEQYKKAVCQLTESFQNVMINRHLFYHLLDLMVQRLFFP